MIDLTAIRERLKAATPGPWQKCSASDGRCPCMLIWATPADQPVASLRSIQSEHADGEGFTVEQAHRNGDLIAHAPIDLRDLCDEVEALRKVADHAQILLSHLDHIGMTREEDELMDNLREALESR